MFRGLTILVTRPSALFNEWNKNGRGRVPCHGELQAERSTCPREQRELRRVTDIYTALATMDMPISMLARLMSSVPRVNQNLMRRLL